MLSSVFLESRNKQFKNLKDTKKDFVLAIGFSKFFNSAIYINFSNKLSNKGVELYSYTVDNPYDSIFKEYNLEEIPVFIFFKNGKPTKTISGFSSEEEIYDEFSKQSI